MRAVFKQIRFEKSIEEKERFAARILALFVLFVSSLFFCRCNSERKFDGERVEVLLIGDWVLKEPKSNYEAIYVYSFFKENNASIFPLSKSAKYYCRQDTLVIDSQLDYYFRHDSVLKSKYFFKILKLDSAELFIYPISKNLKESLKSDKVDNPDTIKLKRQANENNVELKRIVFCSSGCFGTCPSMFLEIDSLGNLSFEGRNYTKKIGFFSGKLTKLQLDNIFSKIHKIKLDSLEEHYEAGWTDDQSCGVIIETSIRNYKSSAYGIDKEPKELRMLLNELINLHELIDLKKDTSIQRKFKYKLYDFMHEAIPKETIKFVPPDIVEEEKVK